MEMKTDVRDQFRILICFKVVHDLDTVMEEDWRRAGDGNPDVSYTRTLLGCWDEAALETGLRLADQLRLSGRKAEVTALTVGEEIQEEMVQSLYGVKCDRVVFWECREDLRFSPEPIAAKIAAFVKGEGGFDLILTGWQAPVGDSGKLPWALAWYLGLPALAMVKEFYLRDNAVLAVSETEGWKRSYLCMKPMVCAVGNARYPYLRVPTLRERLAAGGKKIWVRTGKAETAKWEEERRVEQPEPRGFYRKTGERRCTLVQGKDTRERAEQLYEILKEEGAL